jgi:hypothetical protein
VTVAPGTFNKANGATFAGQVLAGTPASPLPFVPETFPTPATFEVGVDDVTASATLVPGWYGDVDLPENSILNLSSGNYYFNSFYANPGLHLKLDLSEGYGPIGIYVAGSIFTGSGLITTLTNGGSAHDVYIQTNGDWNSEIDTNGTFYGTVYAPYGDVYIANKFTFTGAVYGNSVTIDNGLFLDADPINFSRFVVPAPGALLLGAMGIGMVAWLRRRV